MAAVLVLLLLAGTAYFISRRDTGINEDPRAEAEEENRMETCESTEDVGEEEPVSSEEPETVSAQNGEETEETPGSVSEAETQWRVYDTLSEIEKAWDLPYVDEATFAWIQAAYEEVDFSGEFENGNPDTYEEYQEIFRKLIRNEVPYVDPEMGEELYIKDGMLNWNEGKKLEDYEYRFFDIDGDGMQELYLYYWFGGYDHFFKYDAEKEEILLWSPRPDGWGPYCQLSGTGKIMNVPLEKYLSYEQYDEDGNQICETYFFFNIFNAENVLYVIRMPEYAGQEETIPEEMKVHGAFARDFGEWYFRITEEQYDRISQPYWDAYDTADEKMKEVTYTYEEFMGLPMP